MKDFLEKVRKVKNVRSHIENIEILRITDQKVVTGQGYFSIYRPAAIMPATTLYRTIEGKASYGMHGMTVTHPAAIMMENIEN